MTDRIEITETNKYRFEKSITWHKLWRSDNNIVDGVGQ